MPQPRRSRSSRSRSSSRSSSSSGSRSGGSRSSSSSSRRSSSPFESQPELIVVADPGAGLRARPDGIAAAEVDAAPIEKAVSGGNGTLEPLFGASEERIRHQAIEAAAATGVEGPDLAVY